MFAVVKLLSNELLNLGLSPAPEESTRISYADIHPFLVKISLTSGLDCLVP